MGNNIQDWEKGSLKHCPNTHGSKARQINVQYQPSGSAPKDCTEHGYLPCPGKRDLRGQHARKHPEMPTVCSGVLITGPGCSMNLLKEVGESELFKLSRVCLLFRSSPFHPQGPQARKEKKQRRGRKKKKKKRLGKRCPVCSPPGPGSSPAGSTPLPGMRILIMFWMTIGISEPEACKTLTLPVTEQKSDGFRKSLCRLAFTLAL